MHEARVKKTKPFPSPAEPMWPFPRTMALYLDLKIVLSGSLSANCLHPHVNKSTGESIKNVKCGLQPLLFVFMLVAMWIATLHVYLIILFFGEIPISHLWSVRLFVKSTYKLPTRFYQNEESDWSDDVNRWIVTSHQIAINARHDQVYFWWWVVGPLPLAIFFYLDPSNNEEKKKRFASRRIDLHVMDYAYLASICWSTHKLEKPHCMCWDFCELP